MVIGFKRFHIGIRLLECHFLKTLYQAGNGPKSIPRVKFCEKVVGEEVHHIVWVVSFFTYNFFYSGFYSTFLCIILGKGR